MRGMARNPCAPCSGIGARHGPERALAEPSKSGIMDRVTDEPIYTRVQRIKSQNGQVDEYVQILEAYWEKGQSR